MFRGKNSEHWNGFVEKYPNLASIKEDIIASYTLLINCFRSGNKLITCRNGGRAADAEHIVGELMKGFLKRKLTSEQEITFQLLR